MLNIPTVQFFQRFGALISKKSTDKAIDKSNFKSGVYLVGGGCGDPELITVKAQKLIQSADVLLVDWLVNPAIYQTHKSSAQVIFVGKKCGRHSVTQADIGRLLVDSANKFPIVVRLKGGDPSIFGRVTEEADVLTQHNIPFCIVPGITAASGCASYTGIPLTVRDVAHSVRFVTAHLKHADHEPDWSSLVSENETLVFYMGLNRVKKIAKALVNAGMNINMPLAVIDQGTLAAQSVWTGSLSTVDGFDATSMLGPALIIIGEAVKHRQQVDLQMLTTQAQQEYIDA